jgi:hypothetical protein
MRSRVHSAIGVLLFCAIVVIGHSAAIVVTNNNISWPGADPLSIDGNQALLGLGVFPDKTPRFPASPLTIVSLVETHAAGLFNDFVDWPNDGIAGYDMTIADSIFRDKSGPDVLNYGFVTILNSTLSVNSAGQFPDDGGISSGTFKAAANVTVIKQHN